MSTDLLQEYVALAVEAIRSKKGVKGRFGEKFDLKRFKTLPSPDVMVVYANNFLETLGQGSSRRAYLYSSRYALKVAINAKGIAQNEAELDVFTNPKSKDVVAKVYSADPENRWVVSDLVKPLQSEDEFQSLTGIEWERFTEAMHDFVKEKRTPTPDLPPFVKAVISTAQQNNLLVGDLEEISHWGKTPSGRCVLLDYGFTHEVWQSHYSNKAVEPKSATSDEKTKKPEATSGQKPTPINPRAKTAVASTDKVPDTDKTRRSGH